MERMSRIMIAVICLMAGTAGAVARSAEPSRASTAAEYLRRVDVVTEIPGLAAFWDFVERDGGPDGDGHFVARTAVPGERRYPLMPWNISRTYWNEGDEATMADFPLLGRGPFGQAVQFRDPRRIDDLPVLMVPRKVLHDTPLDVKGPGKSVSMVVWMVYQGGDHAIGGIWHEGTDTKPTGPPAAVKVRGQRQYGMFAGLGANLGASSAHVSENGLASFGDRYARHLAVTPEKMTARGSDADGKNDSDWSTVGFVYDNQTKTVTAYLDGRATPNWVEQPGKNGFFKATVKAWEQGRYARFAGEQAGEDPLFPADQRYRPPEVTPLEERVESDTPERRVVLRFYEFTKVRVTLVPAEDGTMRELPEAELAALKVNPYWIGHDLFSPASAEVGGPFTLGRVIHSNRHPTLSAWFGGAAVYARALEPDEMARLASLDRPDGMPTALERTALVDRP